MFNLQETHGWAALGFRAKLLRNWRKNGWAHGLLKQRWGTSEGRPLRTGETFQVMASLEVLTQEVWRGCLRVVFAQEHHQNKTINLGL